MTYKYSVWHPTLLLFVSLMFTIPVYAAVVINEIYPKPSDEVSEWIELYNNGSESVSLNLWKLQNTTTAFAIGASPTIAGHGFLTFAKSQTGITLSNEGDTVKLLDASGNQVDSQSYPSVLGYSTSVGRTVDGAGVWVICATPATPNTSNNCPMPSPTATPMPTSAPIATLTPIPTSLPVAPPTPTPIRQTFGSLQTTPPEVEVLGVNTSPTPTPMESMDLFTFQVNKILLIQILTVLGGWGIIAWVAYVRRKK